MIMKKLLLITSCFIVFETGTAQRLAIENIQDNLIEKIDTTPILCSFSKGTPLYQNLYSLGIVDTFAEDNNLSIIGWVLGNSEYMAVVKYHNIIGLVPEKRIVLYY